MTELTVENLLSGIKDREKWLETLKELFGSSDKDAVRRHLIMILECKIHTLELMILERKIDRLESEVKELQGELSVYKKVLEILKEEQCSTY